jgi:hypothetical protein
MESARLQGATDENPLTKSPEETATFRQRYPRLVFILMAVKTFILLYGVNFLVQVQREMWSLTKSQLKNTIKVFTST